MKTSRPIFASSVVSLIAGIIICFFFVRTGDKPKKEFNLIEGTVIALDKTNDNYPGKDSAKFRYLLIDNYTKPFELFVGKSAGDFKPKFEKIDSLKINDIVKIYFDETSKTKWAPVNNLVYYIDRANETIFIEGNSKKNLMYGMMIFCVVLILFLLVLKKKGKII